VRTVEPDGLLLYNGGQSRYRDFFAIELYDGIASVVIDLGDGVYRYPMAGPTRRIDDGVTHFLRVVREERLEFDK